MDFKNDQIFYRKTIPIDKGTLIIDILNNMVINISGDFGYREFDLEKT